MKYPAEVLTRQEVGALLEACGKEKWTDRRNYALIVLLYRTGLRLAEALDLRPCDIDTDRGAIRVLRGKGGRARTVGIDPVGLQELFQWRVEHSTRGHTVGDPLFITGSGQVLAQGYWRRRLPELGRLAGIYKRVHSHGLRHTHASELRSEGIDVAVIKRQLGHVSLITTIQYLDHLGQDSIIKAIASRSVSSFSHAN